MYQVTFSRHVRDDVLNPDVDSLVEIWCLFDSAKHLVRSGLGLSGISSTSDDDTENSDASSNLLF